jgi:NDP-sugar pyrophosphorylase family protein
LSHDLPKALMPFWGRPMLAHTLDMLRRWGVREVWW